MSRYQYVNGSLLPIAGYQVPDNALSTTSENPVQNKIITGAINELAALSGVVQSFYTGEVSTFTFDVPANYRGVMFVTTSNIDYQGEWLISMGANGTLYPYKIAGGSGLSVSSPSSNKVQITQSGTPRGLRIGFLNLTSSRVSVPS